MCRSIRLDALSVDEVGRKQPNGWVQVLELPARSAFSPRAYWAARTMAAAIPLGELSAFRAGRERRQT
jgi:hypothetical protein